MDDLVAKSCRWMAPETEVDAMRAPSLDKEIEVMGDLWEMKVWLIRPPS